VRGIRIDFARCPQDDWSVRPGKENALTANNEDLVGFEQPGYRPDCLDKVFIGSNERLLCHAATRAPTGASAADLAARRLAACQIRRLSATSLTSIPSAMTNGDDRRKRVISSSRLVKRRRSFDGGRRSKSFHSFTNE